MNILFLDIDGTLVTRSHQQSISYKEMDDGLPYFDPEVVEVVKEYCKITNSDIVVISTWRTAGLERIQEIFEKRGIERVIGVTPIGFEFKTRGEEIRCWINNSYDDIDKFIIVNDRNIETLEHALLKTNPLDGFVDLDDALKLFENS